MNSGIHQGFMACQPNLFHMLVWQAHAGYCFATGDFICLLRDQRTIQVSRRDNNQQFEDQNLTCNEQRPNNASNHAANDCADVAAAAGAGGRRWDRDRRRATVYVSFF